MELLDLVKTSTFLVNRAEDRKLEHITREIFNNTDTKEKCSVGVTFSANTLKTIRDTTFSMFLEYDRTATYGEFLFYVVKKFTDFMCTRFLMGGLNANKTTFSSSHDCEAEREKFEKHHDGSILRFWGFRKTK